MTMGYPNDFIEMLERCSKKGYVDKFIIGGGNPDSNILFVGKEPTDDAEGYNTLEHYREKIKNGKVDNWTRCRVQEEDYFKEKGKELPNYWNKTQSLWSRYQTLCDYIYPERKKNRKEIFDFEEIVFCSEMNGSPSKNTATASKGTINSRKSFFKDPYFSRFKVILLACGNYINNNSSNPEEREIDNIFDVEFATNERPNPREYGTKANRFWIHYNKSKTRLVIHTRNLSNGVPNKMLKDMGLLIREFLDKLPK